MHIDNAVTLHFKCYFEVEATCDVALRK